MKFHKLDRQPLLDAATEQIAAGNVVGWFQGRMEWGPRALGNRSIVAHPGLPNMKDMLNARIKQREWFRPFAPSMLAERQHEYFEHDHPSPFMLHVYKIRPEKRARALRGEPRGRYGPPANRQPRRESALLRLDQRVRPARPAFRSC